MPKNWESREKKLERRKHGMQVTNRSIFAIQQVIGKRAEQAQKERKDNGTHQGHRS